MYPLLFEAGTFILRCFHSSVFFLFFFFFFGFLLLLLLLFFVVVVFSFSCKRNPSRASYIFLYMIKDIHCDSSLSEFLRKTLQCIPNEKF